MGPHVEYFPGIHSRPSREAGFAPNAVLGMAIFLLAEIMFFSGLISAYLVLRSGFGAWPPPGQPRLSWEVTAFSSGLLLMSGGALYLSRHFALFGAWIRMRRYMSLTIAFGAGFLFIQGFEWVGLLGYGFRVQSGIYASTFYLLIGCHALHVMAGLAYLLYVRDKTGSGASPISSRERLVPALMYWTFVVALWPVLYALVYF